MKNRKIVLVMIMCLVMGFLFAGAEKEADTSESGRPTIKMFLYDWPSKDDAFVKEAIDDALDMTIDWVHCPADEGWAAQERLLAADPTIDVFYLNKTRYTDFRAKGMLLDVGPYINTGEYPAIDAMSGPLAEVAKDSAGKLYGVPYSAYGAAAGSNLFYLILRGDWLEEAGLAVPETIDELDTILEAFKKRNPDKFPLLDQAGYNYYASYEIVSRSFSESGGAWYFDEGTGLMTHPVLHPQFKNYVAKMAEWYAKGYLHPQFLENASQSMVQQLMMGDEVGAVFAWTTDPIQVNKQWADENQDKIFVPVIGGLEGPAGEGVLGRPRISTYFGINANTKNPEAVMKAIDFFLSEEGTWLANQGVEGRNYSFDADGKLVPNSEYDYQSQYNPYTNGNLFKDVITGNHYLDTQRKFWNEIFFSPERLAQVYFDPDSEIVYDWSGKETVNLKSQVETFIMETMTNTIIGRAKVSDWDKAMEQAKKIGLQKMMEERTELYLANR